ncbi:MAG: divalent metal ion transporter [Candidatus Edwardsbacteria bacterium RIFOXYD12_FULL_50_11]|uniref:Divalent metal ion transporter n=1 Tax=Candidatus Edwardsbacteria bacterium GWF2_54_11 TaxID=1817851 RepID=A0A1F5RF24_9BACT|nr:MAG: divalent metal ion transporter [Candidatus Edwardsbacteria bacterium RifOxyC12_full_54_24]OGF07936.1 MAG: divalent metal ion transporter [Candidatus Edwardsbacteria bacterium RifOxyA12_full_54_48]OGF10184.1 MAG: divalent metal ion transporter [Candidatus Edwardsbacteria bacterium GWE2_54_12]OGF12994.1 MAG: divalent metal ion transporter [Candidatus Edwardsbacteria bacterium GWF2_54_11]OGF15096.1 MAG: divalent metal ion transporter [Candidatus Edwardsbacteria bacterium RIFOXYD12_FULL_50_
MLRICQIKDHQVSDCSGEQGPIWVYTNPSEQEKKHLVNELKIDEHTLASALDPDELSRLEFEPDHAALIFKRPKNYSSQDELLFKVSSVGLFLFKDRLIVVMPEEAPLFEGKQFQRVASLNDLLLKLIYRSIFHYLEHLKIINMITDSLEDKISSSMENKYLLNLFTLEKSLVYYLNAINSNSMLIEKLKTNAAKIGFSPEGLEFLDDIIIENNQCYRQAEIYSNILASMMDARASIVSNNLNVLMKTLNIITIGIMVPTFVVSAFSMNVGIPLSWHPSAFWMVMGLALVSVVAFMLFWRFKKW